VKETMFPQMHAGSSLVFLHIILPLLQGLQPSEQRIILLPRRRGGRAGVGRQLFEGGTFRFQGRLGVAVGGVQVGMPQPPANDGAIDPRGDEMNGGGMPEYLGRHPRGRQRWEVLRRPLDIVLELGADPCGAARLAIAVHKEWCMRQAGLTAEQGGQQVGRRWPGRTEALLLALPHEACVRGCVDVEGPGTEIERLVDARPRIISAGEERVIPLALQRRPSRLSQAGCHLFHRQIAHVSAWAACGGEAQHGRTLGRGQRFVVGDAGAATAQGR
jgi:hypothetical protein